MHGCDPLGYEPLFFKVRLARQTGPLLPVADLRYQIADYVHRAAKLDVQQVLNMARRASSIMATQLEITSDE